MLTGCGIDIASENIKNYIEFTVSDDELFNYFLIRLKCPWIELSNSGFRRIGHIKRTVR